MRCCKEMNGYTWPERRQIESFQELKDDGTTACGGWLYCGVYPKEEHNHARARRAGRAGRARHASRLGLGLAGQPAHHVQPRLRRPRGQARGPSASG